ncbi:amino acid ABC transporter permease [Salinibacterium sp. G-O1]|uniref:amino acid ABC transporter permease n=1 Tax=Salinibacterium sp. G-O1 TaxID=3046208 RepID=UPI0024B8F385|nr:amino acid ABC transporter permease [Salinibacterium sp. G-O1]MDJ0333857.1 amino acid ABC transporter permease [Salinibacterium sp. G-O1]
MNFDFIEYLPPLLVGAGLTIVICTASGILGSILGIVFGTAKASPSRIARWVSSLYVNFIRGVPILIILLFTYFALPLIVPSLTLDRGATAVVALSIYSGAYMAEIMRGGIQAVPKGQSEAATALGLNYFTSLIWVVMPQALKMAVPPGIGFLIALVKASSLVSVIGFVDLTRAGRIVTTINQEPLTTFLVVALLYFIISFPISLFGSWAERKLA